MQIAVDYRNATREYSHIPYDSFHLYLHKSISTRTAFYILQTPVFVRKEEDEDPLALLLPDWARSFTECLALITFAYDRDLQQSSPTQPRTERLTTPLTPVSVILDIFLYPEARLHHRHPDNLRDLTFKLAPTDTKIRGVGNHKICEGQSIDTAVEILKSRGLHPSVRPWEDPGRQCYSFDFLDLAPHLADWHVGLELSRQSVESFIERVGRNFGIAGETC